MPQVSDIGLALTFSMTAGLMATGGLCSWHFYQLAVVVPLLSAPRRQQRLQQQQQQSGGMQPEAETQPVGQLAGPLRLIHSPRAAAAAAARSRAAGSAAHGAADVGSGWAGSSVAGSEPG